MCGSECLEFGPPPNNILSMPPPPLPSFLLPRSAIVTLTANDTQPCFAAFICDTAPGPREQLGIEYIEMPGKGMDDTWLLILISSCVGVILLGALLAIIVLKCRDSFNYAYQDSTIKQPPRQTMCGGGGGVVDTTITATKSHQFLNGTMLYPSSCTVTNNQQTMQQQFVNDNRMLWAALTPNGTRHFVADTFPTQDDHYEVIDYENKHVRDTPIIKRTPIKSFDNNGFIDYDYEDPTPLIDSYNTDDIDSGYQEPHEILGTLSRCSPRPLVSSPTRIENPNIPPLNMYPHRTNGTLNKKSTINRRISDTSSYGS